MSERMLFANEGLVEPTEPVILYFTQGEVPTEDDRAEAARIGTRKFRNASRHDDTCALEACHAVAGFPPAAYRRRFPTAEEFFAEKERERQAALDAQKAEEDAHAAREKARREEQEKRDAEARVKAEEARLKAEAEAKVRLEAADAAKARVPAIAGAVREEPYALAVSSHPPPEGTPDPTPTLDASDVKQLTAEPFGEANDHPETTGSRKRGRK